MILVTRFIRAGALIVGHLLTAMLGTAILDSEIYHLFHPPTLAGSVRLEDGLSASIAFGLGYVVFYKWESRFSLWIWLIGAFWFGQQAIRAYFDPGLHGETIFWEFVSPKFGGRERLENWLTYTIPLVRTVFYSAGAFCCSRFGGFWTVVSAENAARRDEIDDGTI